MKALALLVLLVSFEDAESEAVQLPAEQRVAAMQRWLDAAPHTVDEVARAQLWQVQQLMGTGEWARAASLAAGIHATDEELRLDVQLTRADLEFAQGHWHDAEVAYARLEAPAGSRWELQARLKHDAAHSEWLRFLLLCAVGSVAVLVLGWRARQVPLRPMPEEAKWALPVLLLLAIAGVPREHSEFLALEVLAVGGGVTLWVQGAWNRARPAAGLSRLGEVLLSVALTVTLLFAAVQLSGLWMRVAETFAAGTE